MADDPQAATAPAPDGASAAATATPADPRAAATLARIAEQLPDAVQEVVEFRGETTIIVRPELIAEVCAALRDAPGLRYDFLADVAAVDWPERDPRYDVVYHLASLSTRAVVRLKVRVGDEDTPEPEVPSVVGVWPAANWYEREIYDLFGIRFSGHPDMTRILLPDDWVGHPLRKDYPLTGIRLPEPHWGGQVPLDEPVPEGTGQVTLRTPGGVGEAPEAPAPPAKLTGSGQEPD